MATELSSGAISNILEAVPGIATVLRSPVADAIVNLSRAAAGVAPFDRKDALELLRYAVRRGLIRSDEGDRVTAELEHAPKGGAAAVAAKAGSRKPAREPARAKAVRKPARKAATKPKPRPKAKSKPKKK